MPTLAINITIDASEQRYLDKVKGSRTVTEAAGDILKQQLAQGASRDIKAALSEALRGPILPADKDIIQDWLNSL